MVTKLINGRTYSWESKHQFFGGLIFTLLFDEFSTDCYSECIMYRYMYRYIKVYRNLSINSNIFSNHDRQMVWFWNSQLFLKKEFRFPNLSTNLDFIYNTTFQLLKCLMVNIEQQPWIKTLDLGEPQSKFCFWHSFWETKNEGKATHF